MISQGTISPNGQSSMRIPTRSRSGLSFNITPLIDIVFLLIIFFLAASHFARSETSETVNLPEATQHEEDTQPAARRLIVTITADHTLHISGRTVTQQEFEAMLAASAAQYAGDFRLRIRTDERVPYRDIEPLLLAAAQEGVTDVRFAVTPK